MSDTRRTFLKQSAVALTTLAGPRRAAAQAGVGSASAATELDAALLGAIGEVALPSELDARAVEAVVSDFQKWLDGFEAVAELEHGYGTDQIRYGPPHPGPRWQSQLEALELEAHKRFGMGFAALPAEERRALVRREVTQEQRDMPAPATAQHVATGLIAYYFTSPAAVDLCYGVQIGQYGCRGLASAPERPAPLPRRG
jgi:hypothetical protein